MARPNEQPTSDEAKDPQAGPSGSVDSLADAPEDVDAIVEAIVYLYTESRRITKGLAGRHGLTGPQLAVIKMLEPVGKLSLSELSWKIRARNSTVTGIIDRMAREGWVERKRSDADRRVVHIALTARGRRLASSIAIEPVTIFRQVLSELSESDARALRRILTRLARRVRALVAELPESGS
ncbi:MAG TPA: MarR family transcriptional regulator [Polyangiaceae bacterium]|nr:MarR family transcriptional regulator [Polyangiaceae bacterium]